ncbi:MAG: tripartite tricarboxylate transporter substrate binding protein [bacterium]|nr:tripartite tricarboxylate transporter substrate binding protein [Betaproteobacteria bacterium]
MQAALAVQAAVLAAAWCITPAAHGQPAAFPSKPVRIIVPVAPGGGIDLVARAIAPRLGEELGQPVVVENRAGNAMVTGTDAVAKSAADGYTLGLNNTNLAATPALRRSLPFDTLRDLVPVSLLATQPSIVVVHPSLPVRTMGELLRLAKARPNDLAYGSGGIGTSIHLAAALIAASAGIEMLHVPYKGAGPVLADLVGGHLQLAVPTLGSALPFVNNGRLRALGVTTAKRLPSLPQVPTVAESGLPGYEFTTWYGLTAPGGTPAPVVAALHAAVVRTIGDPAVAASLVKQELQPATSTPAEFAGFLKAEVDKWAKVARVAKIPVE